jgi:hypothetical protein
VQRDAICRNSGLEPSKFLPRVGSHAVMPVATGTRFVTAQIRCFAPKRESRCFCSFTADCVVLASCASAVNTATSKSKIDNDGNLDTHLPSVAPE